MVIHGDSDPVVPLGAGKEVAAAIPAAEFCLIQGMGHDFSPKFINHVAD